jgi:hypothetical protein
LGIQISKDWGKHPFWFDTQPKKIQLVLLAEYQISHSNPKDNSKSKKQKFDDILLKRNKRLGRFHGNEKNKFR